MEDEARTAPEAGRGDDRFRLLADCAPVMIWQVGEDGACGFVNRHWLDFRGRALEDELGRGWIDGVHPDDRDACAAVLARSLLSRGDFEIECRLLRRDGGWRWVLGQARPCLDGAGGFTGFVGCFTDITERREAEERQRRDLAEREALLLEVHHRTRNTLQAVIGLLNLQGATISDADARARFGETVQRVRALGLTQDTAYQTPDFARVELGPLVERLASGLKLHYDRSDVSVDIELGYMSLPLEPAVPMGLLLNELLSNALRHAYPAGSTGLVRVAAERRPDGRVAVVVSDDGDGLPRGWDARSGGLGLKLARILAGQLRAELEIGNSPGARFSVILPEGLGVAP